jgi:hypothetical protein
MNQRKTHIPGEKEGKGSGNRKPASPGSRRTPAGAPGRDMPPGFANGYGEGDCGNEIQSSTGSSASYLLNLRCWQEPESGKLPGINSTTGRVNGSQEIY